MVVMSTPGKDRFGLGPLYPETDRRRASEITAGTLDLGKRIWSRGRVLLRDSTGDRQRLWQLRPPDKGCPDSHPAFRFVPWGGKCGRLARCLQSLHGWHGYTGFTKGAETLDNWHKQRHPASSG